MAGDLDLEHDASRKRCWNVPGEPLLVLGDLRFHTFKSSLRSEVSRDFAKRGDPQAFCLFRFQVIQQADEGVSRDWFPPGGGITNAVELECGPGAKRNRLLDPSVVNTNVIFRENRLAGQVIPVWIGIGPH